MVEPMHDNFLPRQLAKAVTFSALMIAVPAEAQMTNCVANGPFLNCQSSDGSFSQCNLVGNVLNCQRMGGQQMTPQPNANGGAAKGIADFIHSIRVRKAKGRVAKALRAGDCAAAMDAAFATSDPEYISSVQSYCTQGSSPQP